MEEQEKGCEKKECPPGSSGGYCGPRDSEELKEILAKYKEKYKDEYKKKLKQELKRQKCKICVTGPVTRFPGYPGSQPVCKDNVSFNPCKCTPDASSEEISGAIHVTDMKLTIVLVFVVP